MALFCVVGMYVLIIGAYIAPDGSRPTVKVPPPHPTLSLCILTCWHVFFRQYTDNLGFYFTAFCIVWCKVQFWNYLNTWENTYSFRLPTYWLYKLKGKTCSRSTPDFRLRILKTEVDFSLMKCASPRFVEVFFFVKSPFWYSLHFILLALIWMFLELNVSRYIHTRVS
jgi:hypothetical protein